MAATLTLSIPDLLGIIGDCTSRIKICTPSEDYYRRSTDWSEDTLEYINPHYLIEKLTELYDQRS